MSAQAEAACDLQTNWSPEMQVLIACARVGGHQAAPPVSLDLDLLLRLAQRHELTSHLYQSLATFSEASADLRQAITNRHRANVQRGLRQGVVLVELMTLLRSRGLHPLPYKGAVLSAQIFSDAALREAGDIDILLPESEVLAAGELLTSQGFRQVREYRPGIERQLLKYRAELGFVRDDVLVELQWRLAPRYFSVAIDVTELLERAGRVTVAGAELPTMSVEDTLLVLCVHGAKHHWGSLKWLVDIDRLVRKIAPDWPLLLQRAGEWGVRRMLLLGLHLSCSLLETPLPQEVQNLILEDPEIPSAEKTVWAGIESGQEPSELEHHRLMLKLRERMSDRMLYLLRLGWQPTESEWEAVNLPAGLEFGYHGVRVARVLAKALGATSS